MTPVVSAPQAMKKGRRKSSSVKKKKRLSIAKMKSNGKRDVSREPSDGLGDIAEGKVQHAAGAREGGEDGEDDEKERGWKSKSKENRGQLLAMLAAFRNAASTAYAALKDAEARMFAAPAGSPERAELEKEVAAKKAVLQTAQEEVESSEAAVAKAEEESVEEDAGEGGGSLTELSADPPAAAHGETNERSAGSADGGCGGDGDGEGGGSGGGDDGDTVGELAPPLALTVSSICDGASNTRDGGDKSEVLSLMSPAEGAVALSAMTSEEQAVALESASPATRAAVLAAMSPDDRAAAMAIIASFPTGRPLKKLYMSPKERAAVLWALGQEERVAALAAMSKKERAAALAFASPEDRAAALAAMNTDDRAEAMEIITSFSTHGRRVSVKVRSSFSVGRDPKMIMKTLSSTKEGGASKSKLESVPSALCVLARSEESIRSPKQRDTKWDELNHVDEVDVGE